MKWGVDVDVRETVAGEVRHWIEAVFDERRRWMQRTYQLPFPPPFFLVLFGSASA